MLPLVLAAIGRPSRTEIERVLHKIRNHESHDLGPEILREVGSFMNLVAADAGPREVLYMLDWVSGDQLEDGEHVRPFVAAANTALGTTRGTALDEWRFATGMTQSRAGSKISRPRCALPWRHASAAPSGSATSTSAPTAPTATPSRSATDSTAKRRSA